MSWLIAELRGCQHLSTRLRRVECTSRLQVLHHGLGGTGWRKIWCRLAAVLEGSWVGTDDLAVLEEEEGRHGASGKLLSGSPHPAISLMSCCARSHMTSLISSSTVSFSACGRYVPSPVSFGNGARTALSSVLSEVRDWPTLCLYLSKVDSSGSSGIFTPLGSVGSYVGSLRFRRLKILKVLLAVWLILMVLKEVRSVCDQENV